MGKKKYEAHLVNSFSYGLKRTCFRQEEFPFPMHLMHMPCTLLNEPLHQEYTVHRVHTHTDINI